MRMTAFKQRFQREFGRCETKSVKYSLKSINDQSPKVYAADEVMKQHPGKRCVSFVLCICASSTTGVYVVEEKGNRASIETVRKQLQSGADFLCGRLTDMDKFEFLPILVAKGMSSSMHKELLRVSIKLREKTRQIRHVKPKAPLPPIVA